MIKQVSSDKKRILVFSDPHQDAEKVKLLLNKEDYDFAVCLGDWFDSHIKQSATDLAATCSLVRQLPFKKNFLTLFGNHDLHYFFINRYARCSGYTDEKDTAITDMLHPNIAEIRDKFQWYVWIDDYLCTHAGIHPYFFPPNLKLTKEGITAWLDAEIKKVKPTIESGGSHWFYRAGYARYGNQKFGGLVWLDANEEAEVIDGIKQIYGHTFHSQIIPHHSEGSLSVKDWNNICIDCNINQYLIIQDRNIEIKKFIDL